jgi:hypothetical protein
LAAAIVALDAGHAGQLSYPFEEVTQTTVVVVVTLVLIALTADYVVLVLPEVLAYQLLHSDELAVHGHTAVHISTPAAV